MSTKQKLSVEEFDAMVERGDFVGFDKNYELIRGELRKMNPAGPVHDDLVEYLNRWSISNTDPEEIRVRIQSGLDLELDSRPEPDIFWIKAKSRRYFDSHPKARDVLLLIEVADSSFGFDMKGKSGLYAEAGIAEYWVVEVERTRIHGHRNPISGRFQESFVVDCSGQLSPSAQPAATLDVADLFGSE